MDIYPIVEMMAGWARSYPFILLLLGSAIYVTLRLRGIQFRKTGQAFQCLIGQSDDQQGRGEVSNFGAMATVLSGTIGTGNIAGVATAITLGGPGAIFWMWVTALFGMALKYACCLLGHHYRRVDARGEIAGGPMYTLKYGLNMPKLGAFFAIATLLAAATTGGMVQSHSVVDGIIYVLPQAEEWRLAMGCIIAFLVGIVILGGVQRIATVASVVVPFMAVAYCGSALVILLVNYAKLPGAFMTIFTYALNPWSAGAGMLGAAIQFGVLRALFASEAGLGTAPIALAATKTNYCVRAGLIGMIGPWFDTMLICTMTALVIIIAGFYGDNIPHGLVGAGLSAAAFEQGLENAFGHAAGVVGAVVVGAGLVFFAYTTIIAWAYYGDRAMQFLLGPKAVTPFRLAFIALTLIGAVSSLEMVWALADIANVLMAVPNIISLLLLAGMVKKATDDYFSAKTHLVPESDCVNPPAE
ncbi:MAG: alanine/glycine:cation symporter family protein [Gammaproteobacteria bacterium]